MRKKLFAVLLAVCMLLTVTACGQAVESAAVNTEEVAGDYYLDLTELGMKLTVYLRLNGDGSFKFSNTLDFETDKSSGTFQKSGDEYVMVFTSVNGEEKSVSDGLTSSFVVTENGSLDFSGGAAVPYGSANINTVAADDPNIKLMGIPVSEDYTEPEAESDFQTGTYTAEHVTEDGVTYSHTVTFYEDHTYLHVICCDRNEFSFESGTYGVSTTQLALEQGDEGHEGRIESEIVDGSNLILSVYPTIGAAERVSMDFVRTDAKEKVMEFSGSGTEDNFDVTMVFYTDGSYEVTADGHTETGILVINTASSYIKQYPDHPTDGTRGLSVVATVPSGTCAYDADGVLTLTDLRVCTSENLSRYKCNVTAISE